MALDISTERDLHHQSKLILVIEDDEEICRLLALVISNQGYSVYAARNGREGLELLRSLKRQPCVIFLDMMMPVMNGWEFLAEIQKDPPLMRIPIIAITATRDPVPQELLDGLLKKPIDIYELIRIVKDRCDDPS